MHACDCDDQDDFKPIDNFMAPCPLIKLLLGVGSDRNSDAEEPRLSFQSMERDSDGHGLPALKTHSGYVEESLGKENL